jgi:hypothetical protein
VQQKKEFSMKNAIKLIGFTALAAVLFSAALGYTRGTSSLGGGGRESPATDFKYELNASRTGVVIKEYIGQRSNVVIPAKIEGYPVLEISEFLGYRGASFFEMPITSVVIPKNIIYIGKRAFENCMALKAVTLPDTLEVIETGVFKNCKALTKIELPKSLKVIEKGAFSGTGLTSIVIPEGVTTIENGIFYECVNLASVTLPNSLERIKILAFYGCTSLTEVKLPSHSIVYEPPQSGFAVFDNCPRLSLATRKAITDSGYTGGF